MGEVYIYAPDAEDFDTMGLCGALSPTSCVHTEAKNDLSEIRLEHPIDENGRWTFLQNDYILKCDVPVRTVPPITPEGTLVTAHEVWTIRTGTTKAQRNLYYHATGDAVRKKNLPVGMHLPIIFKGENRYKAVFTGKKKVRRKGKWVWKTYTCYGWIAKSAIQYTLTEDWPNDPAAIETVAPAWIVADQLFRIYKVELRDDGVTAYARHIFYDLLNNLTSYPAGRTSCVDAVDGILGNCLAPTPFSGFTDIGGERVTDGWTRVNPVSALLDPETGVAALWGAELVRDNCDFFLLRDAGLNRGVRIEYAKNLLGVSCEVDASDVVTRIVPVGKDKSGKDLLLAPGSYNVDGIVYTIGEGQTWIDSPRASLYPTPHVQAITCSGECKETKTVTKPMVRVRMIREALAALANDADLPKVSLKVEFLSLGDTEEYAQYRSLEDVFLYDRIRVKHPGIHLDVLTEVNRVEFDCLNEKFRSIELGSVRQDMRKTAVASWQLPSTISGRKIAMESISAAQLEPESVEALDLSANNSVIGVAEQTVGITVTIDASRGTVLTAEVPETVLTARVLRGATDLTANYAPSLFSWARSSLDGVGDAAWNTAHQGVKSVAVLKADIFRQATFTCTVSGLNNTGRITVVAPSDTVRQANPPENPTDGLMWLNTETYVLKIWRAGSGGDAGEWEIIADYAGAASMIEALMQGTIENETFQNVMVNAGVLGELATQAKQDLLDNLAKSMDFGENGLTITSVSGKSAARLGTQQLEFLAGLGADAIVVAVFGLLQTITASYLQVGQSAQSPRLRLGEVLFEYTAGTGNLTCRRA
ncbi:phage tail spike protein [Bacillota bacterium Meth-B3]